MKTPGGVKMSVIQTKKTIILLSLLIIMLFVASCAVPQSTVNSTTQTNETTQELTVENPTSTTPNNSSNTSESKTATPAKNTENKTTETPKETTTSAVVTSVKTNNQSKSISEATVKVKENDLLKLKVNYTDPDNDQVNLIFNKPLDKNGEWKTNFGDAGEYASTIVANDGKLTTTTKLKIVVERVNVAPLIEGVEDITAKEGDVIKFEPKITDPNKDQVTITISDPLKKGVFKTDHTSSGDYKIKVIATDGELKTEKNFLLRVLDVNVKPTVEGIPEKLVIKEGEIINLKPKVSDLDNDKLKISISDPVGDDGMWETKFTDHGQYTITIVVDDGKDKVTKKIDLTIQDQNAAPEITAVNLAK